MFTTKKPTLSWTDIKKLSTNTPSCDKYDAGDSKECYFCNFTIESIAECGETYEDLAQENFNNLKNK